MADVNLVLNTFEFQPSAPHTVVELRGRTAGLMGFLLNRLGLAQESYLIVTRGEVQFRFVRFSGMTVVFCPLDKITSVYCGVSKPTWALYLGIIFLLALPTIILPLIGLALLFHFYRTQYFTLTFSTGDMLNVRGMEFAAFTKNNKQITVETLLEIVEYMNSMLLHTQPETAAMSTESQPTPDDDLIDNTPPPILLQPVFAADETPAAEAAKGIVTNVPTFSDEVEEETIDAELATMFGDISPETASPVEPAVAETPVELPPAEKITVVAQSEPAATHSPAEKSAAKAEPVGVKPTAEKPAMPPAARREVIRPETQPQKPAIEKPGTAGMASSVSTGQLADTKPRKAEAAAAHKTSSSVDSQLADTKPKKPRQPTEQPPDAPTIEARSVSPAAKLPPPDSDVWKTGEMQAVVLPTSGITGTLDLDKQIARQKLREGFELFQKRKYMDALVALKEAQVLDPENPKVQEGIKACEMRLRRQ